MKISEHDGPDTSNTPREKGREEEQRQQNLLQQQTCADARGIERKRDRVIVIENSSNVSSQAFVLEEIGSVSELQDKLCARYPQICLDFIGLRISNSRNGNVKKTIFQDNIPYEYDTLYIWLYLKKHPI